MKVDVRGQDVRHEVGNVTETLAPNKKKETCCPQVSYCGLKQESVATAPSADKMKKVWLLPFVPDKQKGEWPQHL